MIDQFSGVNPLVHTWIIYCPSSRLETILYGRLKDFYKPAKGNVLFVGDGSDMKEIQAKTLGLPFAGGKWFVSVQCDGLKDKPLISMLSNDNTAAATRVFWVHSYKQYMTLVQSKIVERMGFRCSTVYAGRLDGWDIGLLYRELAPVDSLSPKLLTFVKKGYTYDVDAVLTLFEQLSSGERVSSERDIVRMIGVGGNSINSVLVKLLCANPKTDKGVVSSYKKIVNLISDLSTNYSFSVIRSGMMKTLKVFICIKELQLVGKYTFVKKDLSVLPEGITEQDILRVKRFDGVLLEKVPLERLLLLYLYLQDYLNFNAEVTLLNATGKFLNAIRLGAGT